MNYFFFMWGVCVFFWCGVRRFFFMVDKFELYQKVCMLAGVDCVSLRLLAVIDEFEF